MCCGAKTRGGTRGKRSGKITRTKKTLKAQRIDTTNEQQHTEDRERLLLLPINRIPDETRDLGPAPVQGPELLP